MGEIFNVQSPIMDHAKATGWLCRRMAYLGRRGCPDLWCFKAGVCLIMEIKDRGEPPTIQQRKEMGRLQEAGMMVFVVDNASLGVTLLDRYSRGRPRS